MQITLFTTPGCPQCRITKRHLDVHGVPYIETDLTSDPDALAYVHDTLGYRSAPIVLVATPGRPDTHWSGYRPDRLTALTHGEGSDADPDHPRRMKATVTSRT